MNKFQTNYRDLYKSLHYAQPEYTLSKNQKKTEYILSENQI